MGAGTVIIDFNDSFTYNVYELLRRCGHTGYRVLGIDALDPDSFETPERIILSPGPGVPSKYPAVFRLLDRLCREPASAPVPLLGICLGHQIICSYFGAELYNLERVVHGQPRAVRLTDSGSRHPLFDGIPAEFTAGLYHSWAAADPLPEDIELTVRASDGVVMGVAHRELPLCGVQFHPESFISEYGGRLLTNFLKM